MVQTKPAMEEITLSLTSTFLSQRLTGIKLKKDAMPTLSVNRHTVTQTRKPHLALRCHWSGLSWPLESKSDSDSLEMSKSVQMAWELWNPGLSQLPLWAMLM